MAERDGESLQMDEEKWEWEMFRKTWLVGGWGGGGGEEPWNTDSHFRVMLLSGHLTLAHSHSELPHVFPDATRGNVLPTFFW